MSEAARVVHVMPDVSRAFGGPTFALVGYVGALREVGIAADVLAPACDAADAAWLRDAMPGSQVHLLPHRSGGVFATAAALGQWLRARRERYDVVHVHGLLHPVSSLTARAARAQGQGLVICPFGTMSRYTFRHRRRTLKRMWFGLLDRPNLVAADAIQFCTEPERDEARWLGVPLEGRSWIAPPPWRGDGGDSAPAFRDGTRVLFLGRLHPKKGIEILLDAWPAVRARIPTATLTIAGDGDAAYVASLHDRAARSGAGIRFTGFVSGDDKRRQLEMADVFVLSSYQENFGVAVIEAIVEGVPVVVSPEVQLAPFVAEHRLGHVTERNPHALAASICAVLGDASLREHVRSQGRRLVDAHFSFRVVGRELARMYAAVRARRREPVRAA